MKKATNAALMKERNKKLILHIISKKECSRADISRITGLTKAAVTIIIDELIADGYIEEYTSDYTGVGRKPIFLKLQADAAYAVGINITRKKYEVGIINLNGDIIESAEFNITNPDAAIEQITKTIDKQIAGSGIDSKKILGIGITTPGPVNYKENTILNPPNFDQWHNLKLDFLPSIHLENISNAAALTEKYYGSCIDTENYIMFIVDEGIGSGIIADNKIYRGNSGRGNEAGHISIDFNGKPCECGNVGCLEKYASVPAILTDTKYSSWKEVIDCNDMKIIQKEADYLSYAITTIINLFDISTILLSGDISYKGDIISDEIKKKVLVSSINKNEINIIPAKQKSGILIAACTIIDDFFTKEADIP